MYTESYYHFIAGEFGIVYRARLTKPTIRKTDCEIVAVKTIKGKVYYWQLFARHVYVIQCDLHGSVSPRLT